MEQEATTKVMKQTVDVSQLKVGDRISRTEYYEVTDISIATDDQGTYKFVNVKNRKGFTFRIGEEIVKQEMISANQYDEEQLVTRTALVEIFTSIGDGIFTINYHKQVKEKDVLTALGSLYANEKGHLLSKSEYNKKVKEIVKNVYLGENRTLIGYKIENNVLGRVTVVDLEVENDDSKPYDTNIRQVDLRTLNYLIYKRVKYIVKGK